MLRLVVTAGSESTLVHNVARAELYFILNTGRHPIWTFGPARSFAQPILVSATASAATSIEANCETILRFRSFRNPAKYAYAHEMCLSAAASVLDSNLQAIRLQPGERFWVSIVSSHA
jgi:hypothetical protein